MAYIEKEKVLSAVCPGCNKEFSDEPCEPDACVSGFHVEQIVVSSNLHYGQGFVRGSKKGFNTATGDKPKIFYRN